MDHATRLQYLEAMGIDVWVSRHQPTVEHVVDASENVGWAEHSEAHRSHHEAEGASTNHDRRASLNSVQPAESSHTYEQSWHDLQQAVANCRDRKSVV